MNRITYVNYVIYTKVDERYVIAYDDDRRSEALKIIGRWAANPD